MLGFDLTTTDFRYPEEIIHAFIGGSALHGAKMDGTDDLDIYGVFVEPPDKILGLDKDEHFVWSTAGPGRNGPEDVDVCLYGLRKWAGLACKGNPSVLHFLFAGNLYPVDRKANTWQHLTDRKRDFLAKSHYKQFLGYAQAQLARMVGERSRKVNRPELVLEYGFDTKFAMHVIRILVECEELLATGWISLPSPEKDMLIEIRKGQRTQEWVMKDALQRIGHIEELARTSNALPEEIDRQLVSSLIASLYREHWRRWKI